MGIYQIPGFFYYLVGANVAWDTLKRVKRLIKFYASDMIVTLQLVYVRRVQLKGTILTKFVTNCPTDNKSALVQQMAWRLTGDKILSETMMTQFTDAYIYNIYIYIYIYIVAVCKLKSVECSLVVDNCVSNLSIRWQLIAELKRHRPYR